MKRKIVIIGSGKLATALVSGFIHAGIEKESIMVIGRDALKLSRFNTMGIKTSSAMNDVADAVNVLMAVTPAGAGQILQSLRKAKDECINRAFYVERIISFVSGLTITQINKSLRFPHAKILRATCNTNIAFGQGIICLSGVVNKNTDQCHVKHATQLLSVLGEVVREYRWAASRADHRRPYRHPPYTPPSAPPVAQARRRAPENRPAARPRD